MVKINNRNIKITDDMIEFDVEKVDDQHLQPVAANKTAEKFANSSCNKRVVAESEQIQKLKEALVQEKIMRYRERLARQIVQEERNKGIRIFASESDIEARVNELMKNSVSVLEHDLQRVKELPVVRAFATPHDTYFTQHINALQFGAHTIVENKDSLEIAMENENENNSFGFTIGKRGW